MTRARTPVALLLAALLLPAAGSAQSLLSAGGLGVPVDALDARARALGGVPVGLTGVGVFPTDPVAAAGLVLPAVSVTLSNAWVDVDESGSETEASGARFPAFGVAYPVRGVGTATLTFGGVLDQRWQTTRQHLLPLGGSNARVTDTFVSDGGIAALQLGFARRIVPALAVGGAFGVYTGELTRNLTRTFDSLDVGFDVTDSRVDAFWNYSGLLGTVGATVDLAGALRVGGNVTWSGEVEADPADDTDAPGATFDFPIRYRIGASGALTPALTATAGMEWADWTDAGEPLLSSSGTSARAIGGGIEWTGAALAGRRSPIRIGYRRATLPFTVQGDEAVERAFTAGLGLDLVPSGNDVLAGIGFAIERGSREAGALSESFLRATFTLRVSGF